MTGRYSDGVTEGRTVEELERLTTEELRHQAFAVAERHIDVAFFWDLLEHVPAARSIATEDGSAGNITGGIAEAVAAVREVFGHDLGDAEPLMRARFIDYLRTRD